MLTKKKNETDVYNKFKNYIKIREFHNNFELIESASETLKSNKIISWFQSSSEWGPRALGNRSILANPSEKSVIDEINLALKKEKALDPLHHQYVRKISVCILRIIMIVHL